MIYLELIVGFLEIGLFSFGGAYGAIPAIFSRNNAGSPFPSERWINTTDVRAAVLCSCTTAAARSRDK